MRIGIHTLTPLFTGGVDPRKMDRVHETGILGSLRWWYEAITRGLAGAGPSPDTVCNPTDEDASHRCNHERNRWVCRSCRLFGATGWARRFHLGLGGGKPLFQEGINLRAPGGNTGWYFYPPFVDTGSPIAGRLTNLRDVNAVNDLSIVMRLISAWGGLGAKTQHGFGVVDMGIKDDELGEVTPRVEEFLARFSDGDGEDDHLPSLGNMFFGRLYLREGVPDNWWERAVLGAGANDPLGVEKWRLRKHWIVQEPFSVPSAPAIKYKLRYGWQPPGGAARTHPAPEAGKNAQLFFGQAGSSNRKSMINVSNTFKKDGIWQFRVWGWLPVGLSPIDRDKLMAELSRLITDVSSTAFWDSIFGAGIVDLGKSEWREIDATGHARNRPSASPPANCRDFLRTLLS